MLKVHKISIVINLSVTHILSLPAIFPKINNGYTKELNFISWNHREPVYDIRTWNQEHTKYGKGVTLTLREMALLQDLMKEGE